MKITINRVAEEYPEESLSISQILKRKGWSFPLIIARVDGTLVERKDYDALLIKDGSDIDLYHLVSGG